MEKSSIVVYVPVPYYFLSSMDRYDVLCCPTTMALSPSSATVQNVWGFTTGPLASRLIAIGTGIHGLGLVKLRVNPPTDLIS